MTDTNAQAETDQAPNQGLFDETPLELSLVTDDLPTERSSLWQMDAPTSTPLCQMPATAHPLTPQEYQWAIGEPQGRLFLFNSFKLYPILLETVQLHLNNGFFAEKGVYYLDLERLLGSLPQMAQLPPHLTIQGYYSCDFLLPKNLN